jgi:predicted outer membrane protein
MNTFPRAAILAAALAFSSFSLAATPPPATNPPNHPANPPTTQNPTDNPDHRTDMTNPDRGAQDMTDAQIAGLLMSINQSEIDAGQLVVSRSQNAEVKRYAQMMIDDHRALQTKTRDWMKANNIQGYDDSDNMGAAGTTSGTAGTTGSTGTTGTTGTTGMYDHQSSTAPSSTTSTQPRTGTSSTGTTAGNQGTTAGNQGTTAGNQGTTASSQGTTASSSGTTGSKQGSSTGTYAGTTASAGAVDRDHDMDNANDMCGSSAKVDLSKHAKENLAELASLSGANLDRRYIDMAVQDHQHVLQVFDDQMLAQVDNPDLKRIITDARPKVQAHLDQARRIQATLAKPGQNDNQPTKTSTDGSVNTPPRYPDDGSDNR